MKIGRDNYEQYFIDYLDGKLDPEELDILMSFLELNPDLKKELGGMDRAYLVPGRQTYAFKENLRKTVDPFEEVCIDVIEHQLGEEKALQFHRVISEDAEKQVTFNLYRSTILEPDMNIQYPLKARLKRGPLRRMVTRRFIPAAVAASLILGALLIFGPDGADPDAGEASLVPEPGQPEEISDRITVEETEIPAIASAAGITEVIESAYLKENIEILPFREPIQLARVQPLGITRVMAVSAIPSYALVHKLKENPGRLEQIALDRMDSGLQATRSLPEMARDAIWKLADAGVRSLNQISEEEIQLERSTDNDGRTRALRFETSIFGVSAPLRNTDTP